MFLQVSNIGSELLCAVVLLEQPFGNNYILYSTAFR